MSHAIETGWNPRDGSMMAYCRNCQTWFGAWCSDPTDYLAIRHAEQEARKPFADFTCFYAADLLESSQSDSKSSKK
jgi:hypothetical protein